DDKLAFYEMCKAHALPTPKILAAFAPAGKLVDFATGHPPTLDLYVKPRTGLGSEGNERFRWRDGAFESNRGFRVSPEGFGEYLANRARRENRTLLVQRALSNHSALRLGPNANLAPARLVTGISGNGNVDPICGFIYLARTDEVPTPYQSV